MAHDELVKRLRKARVWPDYSQSRVTIETAHQSADLIEAQAREIERLRAALEKIAAQKQAHEMDEWQRNQADFETGYDHMIHIARAALQETSRD